MPMLCALRAILVGVVFWSVTSATVLADDENLAGNEKPAGAEILVGDGDKIDFNQQIRPILSNNCFACHGNDPSNREESELRLDDRDVAVVQVEVIVPGEPDESTLIDRITSDDPDERMPPAESGKTLTAEQIELLRQWIAEGAEYKKHWSLVPPEHAEAPAVAQADWVRNDIDAFVLKRLEKEQIPPAAEADKETLIRRVTLDLTGLPPTPAEIDAFLADTSPDAYENVVDRLLASPRYGEHKGRYWLDAARYADTYGMHFDNYRSLWPYRDWVIKAFNENMPFDQFTIEQLAGDLLPERTLQQQIATGFTRCHISTNEGGSIKEEVLVRNTQDRTETMATVFLGLTMGCAACHDHKFDPITQKDYYSLFAFFNSTVEDPMNGKQADYPPVVRIISPEVEEQLRSYDAQVGEVRKRIQKESANIEYKDPHPAGGPRPARRDFVWVEDALPDGAKPVVQPEGKWQFVSAPDHPVYSRDQSTTRTAKGRGQHFFTDATKRMRIGDGDKLFAYVYLDPENPPQQIMLQWNDGDWGHRVYWGEDLIPFGTSDTPTKRYMGPLPETGKWVRLEVDAAHVNLQPGAEINGMAFTQFDGTVYWDKAGVDTATPQTGGRFVSLARWEQLVKAEEKPDVPAPILAVIKKPAGERSDEEQRQLRDHFVAHVYSDARIIFDTMHQQIRDIEKQKVTAEKAIPTAEVMQEMKNRRDAFILERGEYDKKGEQVTPDVPSFLPPLPEGATHNRLALAQWLVDPQHPLTARVTVNRMWQQYFGTGLVKTSEDFGSQGEPPSHPKLLDWLATEFIGSGWDVKHMHRLIVTSAAFRQSSAITPDAYERDPGNRLFARGPRYRMDAEVVRDLALSTSGLLVEKIGGESVKPYQPPGIWKSVAYVGSNTGIYKQDHGEALYRRSMYTFWKRTAPPPTMMALDAPSRESCTVRRERTNTPLAALALLNAPEFVEAARNLAQRTITEGGATLPQRIEFAYRVTTARRPTEREIAVLVAQYDDHLKRFQADAVAAEELVSTGESPRDESIDVRELAAWTIIANIILNLDETITKG